MSPNGFMLLLNQCGLPEKDRYTDAEAQTLRAAVATSAAQPEPQTQSEPMPISDGSHLTSPHAAGSAGNAIATLLNPATNQITGMVKALQATTDRVTDDAAVVIRGMIDQMPAETLIKAANMGEFGSTDYEQALGGMADIASTFRLPTRKLPALHAGSPLPSIRSAEPTTVQ